MSRIPLKYHTNVLFYTKYTHPTLICRGTDDLLNYTTLMLKFCTNKRIWASLLRQVCFFGGERGRFAPKKGVTLHPRATDFQEKKSFASSIKIFTFWIFCSTYIHRNLIVQKKRTEKVFGIAYIHT